MNGTKDLRKSGKILLFANLKQTIEMESEKSDQLEGKKKKKKDENGKLGCFVFLRETSNTAAHAS